MNPGRSDCPFCSAPAEREILAKNEYCFAIYDAFPVNKGHVLIIPYRHTADYFELKPEETQAAWSLLSEVQQIIKDIFTPDGFNIGVNVGAAAGQTIGHVHLHLIPRYKGDMENPRGGIRHCVAGKGDYGVVG